MKTLKDDWFPRELPPGLQMGEGSYIDSSYCFLHCDPSAHNVIRMGHDSHVEGVFFELGPDAFVEIGNFTGIGQCTIRAEREVRIGNYVNISFNVIITDCESITTVSRFNFNVKRYPPANCAPLPIRIGDYAWIGFRAIILAGVTIGTGALVGAGAVVSEDVPPMTLVGGNPARVLKRMNQLGRIPDHLKSSCAFTTS